MDEPVKRLAPRTPTIRHLFAHSGNVCAFPGCDHPLIDSNCNFVGEICHIEAAEPGGERFNPSMTNEERRHRHNLLLMCHRHHVETDNSTVWTVEKLRGLKAVHEAKFEEAVQRIADSAIQDLTKAAVVGEPQSLERMADVLGWDLTEEQRLGSLTEMLLPMLESLRKLAPDTRGVLGVVVERGTSYEDDLGLALTELRQVTGRGRRALLEHVDTMGRYGIATVVDDWEGREIVATYTLDGWPFWRDLKQYCEATGFDVASFINDLRFELLD